jgi:PadR family transcriptional regulator PadR
MVPRPHSRNATQRVLRLLARDPSREWFGRQLALEAGLKSGTIYPMLARLEREWGWLESREEDRNVATAEGRPPRRLYRVTPAGYEGARAALAERANRDRVGQRPEAGWGRRFA